MAKITVLEIHLSKQITRTYVICIIKLTTNEPRLIAETLKDRSVSLQFEICSSSLSPSTMQWFSEQPLFSTATMPVEIYKDIIV